MHKAAPHLLRRLAKTRACDHGLALHCHGKFNCLRRWWGSSRPGQANRLVACKTPIPPFLRRSGLVNPDSSPRDLTRPMCLVPSALLSVHRSSVRWSSLPSLLFLRRDSARALPGTSTRMVGIISAKNTHPACNCRAEHYCRPFSLRRTIRAHIPTRPQSSSCLLLQKRDPSV